MYTWQSLAAYMALSCRSLGSLAAYWAQVLHHNGLVLPNTWLSLADNLTSLDFKYNCDWWAWLKKDSVIRTLSPPHFFDELHCKKVIKNFRDITWKRYTKWNFLQGTGSRFRFPRYISYYIAENRLPLGQCTLCVTWFACWSISKRRVEQRITEKKTGNSWNFSFGF